MPARWAFYKGKGGIFAETDKERRELIEFLKKHYILLDVDDNVRGGSKEEMAWCGRVHDACGGTNHWDIATAGGKALGGRSQNVRDGLHEAVEGWKSLPESERKPNVTPNPPQDSPETARATPPPGSLILRVYWSFMDRHENGEMTPVKRFTFYESASIDSRFTFTDVMWVTEEEWKSMVPGNPRKGDKVPLPAALGKRIMKFYAVMIRNNVPNSAGSYDGVRAGEFTLTVHEATPGGFRLRLEGYARKGKEFSERYVPLENPGGSHEPDGQAGGDFRFLGFLSYDAKKKAFDRFDVVSLANAWGDDGEGHNFLAPVYERPGRPYGAGIAFELVSGDLPIHRIPPAFGVTSYAGYFGKSK